MLRHLTWRGRVSLVAYAVRRVFVKPPPALERCVMGSTVHPAVWCPRRSRPGWLWCEHHARWIAGGVSRTAGAGSSRR